MKKHVLCVDDNAANMQLIHRVVELLGLYEVRSVHSAQLALKAIADRAPDLMLIDLVMPGMDGFALLATLKQMPEMERCCFVAVTADVSATSSSKCLAAGFHHYVSKPYELKELHALIKRVLA